MPAPSGLTPEVHADIVKALRAGDSRENAAMCAGIDERTLRTWMRLAAKGDERYAVFAHDVKVALAWARQQGVVAVRVAGRKDWRAHTWWLEHVHQNDFGPRLRVQFEASVAQFLDAMEEEFADPTEAMTGGEVLERIIRRASVAFGAESPPGEAGEDPPENPGG